ncbi:MAG TPA: hypothetical protein PLW83_04720, partial [Deltaproteobacteria bacterium]|nr:hypothetical protein [Deltaproteobacteria bacterium]
MTVRFGGMDVTYVLLAVQIVIQVVLIGFVVLLLVVERRRRIAPKALDELKAVVDKTMELSGTFQENIRQRVDMLTRVMAELEDKMRSAERLVAALEETSARARKSRQFGQEDVRKLHRGGFDPVEISQITG